MDVDPGLEALRAKVAGADGQAANEAKQMEPVARTQVIMATICGSLRVLRIGFQIISLQPCPPRRCLPVRAGHMVAR